MYSVSVTTEGVAKHTSTADQQLFAPGSHQSVRAFKLSYGSMTGRLARLLVSHRTLAKPNAAAERRVSDAYAGAQTTRTLPDNRSDRRRLPQPDEVTSTQAQGLPKPTMR